METTTRNTKEYPKSELVLGNLAIILWIGLDSVAFGMYYLPAAGVFFILAAFLVFFEIGKHGCVTCYYCKTCTVGMGKLPDLFFKQGGTANVNRKAMKLFPFVFVLLSVVPVVLLVFSLVQEFVVYKAILLAAILVFSLWTGVVRRKNLFV